MFRRRPAPPAPSARATLWRTLRGFAFGKLGWTIGAPLLVFSCGALLLWWSYVQHARLLGDVQARATEHVEGRLVDRYYWLERTDLASLPSHSDVCPDLCQITHNSVAEVVFEDRAGISHRAVFRDQLVHDWQHNTPFELGVPVGVPRVKLAPEFLDWLRSEKATSHYETLLWDLWWDDFDSAAHWLLRVRDPVPALAVPLRYDPADPATVLLDAATLQPRQARDAADARGMAWSMPVFLALLGFLVMWPAVQMMTYGLPKWASAAVAVFVVATVPWWAPAAMRIAPWLSETSGQLAAALRREFHGPYHPEFLAWREPLPDGLATIDWTLAASRDAPFVRHLGLKAPSGIDPLDHAGALAALQDGLRRQLTALDDAALLEALAPLNHYQADRVLELFVPALLAIEGDPARGAEVRAQAVKLLAFFVDAFELPDVDRFVYAARLERYALLEGSATPDVARAAREKLAAARALVARQQATMR